jgi:dihydroorotase
MPVNDGTLTLTKQDAPVSFPSKIETPNGPVTVFDPGFDVFWKVT